MARFLVVPVDVAEANRLVVRWHRRHGRARGCKLAFAAVETAGRRLCGVAVLGRPVVGHHICAASSLVPPGRQPRPAICGW